MRETIPFIVSPSLRPTQTAIGVVLILLGSVSAFGQTSSNSNLPRLEIIGENCQQPTWFYVITHGMGGTCDGDRFHLLATQIKRNFPQANVYLVDWSEGAIQKLFGVNSPWHVSRHINPVGDDLASQLMDLGIVAERSTFIGESFGNYVNHRIAEKLKSVRRILAMNPASELGGYTPPDLRKHTDCAWALHTRSVWDTRLDLSDRGFLLQTPEKSTPTEMHTYGIHWLRHRLEQGDDTYLLLNRKTTDAPSTYFDATLKIDGSIDQEPSLRQIPEESSPPIIDRLQLAKE